VQRRSARPGRTSPDGESAATDRRLRRRRLLDGGGQPAARRVRPRPQRLEAAAGLLPALGERRRRPLHRPLLPCLSPPPLPADPPPAVPPRAGAGGPASPPALAGPDLRRWRQPRQPARGLARPRPRLDPPGGVGSGRGPLRALSRVALLVRRVGHRISRRPSP